FHDERNTLPRGYRQAVSAWNHLGPTLQPEASLDDNGALRIGMRDLSYRHVPLTSRSAFAHTLEQVYNRFDASRQDSRVVTETLIEEMAAVAARNGVRFVLAGIDRNPRTLSMLDHARERGITTVDISVDYSLPGYTNEPHDDHPSALANRAI